MDCLFKKIELALRHTSTQKQNTWQIKRLLRDILSPYLKRVQRLHLHCLINCRLKLKEEKWTPCIGILDLRSTRYLVSLTLKILSNLKDKAKTPSSTSVWIPRLGIEIWTCLALVNTTWMSTLLIRLILPTGSALITAKTCPLPSLISHLDLSPIILTQKNTQDQQFRK
jgi:hypothetical protein